MPHKALKACAAQGCAKLFSGAGIYCDEHAKAKNHHYNKYERDPEAKKRYGYHWRKVREYFLKGHPLCEMCRKDGRLTKATEVHHIIPLGKGGTHDPNNLMALCKPCHSRITISS